MSLEKSVNVYTCANVEGRIGEMVPALGKSRANGKGSFTGVWKR